MNLVEVRKLIDANEVVVFGKGDKGEPGGGETAEVQGIFDELVPEYVMVNTSGDREGWREVLGEITDYPDLPQVFIQGKFIGGCDTICEMEEEGELEEMFH